MTIKCSKCTEGIKIVDYGNTHKKPFYLRFVLPENFPTSLMSIEPVVLIKSKTSELSWEMSVGFYIERNEGSRLEGFRDWG